eukprot:GHRR01009029.1.p1 GENE.GHRR01009029.1~~GHRR01009029.1.p1  ORF type:complete len:431 (+),score=113.70 GHRR01009029.1:138-1430(+)
MLSTIPRLARCLSSNLGGISNLTRAFASWPEPVIQVSAQDGNSIVLPTCGAPGDTLLIRQPERPFAATASLPNEVVTSLPGTSNRIAVVRPAFLPFDQQQQHLSEVIAPLGTSAVALAAHTQLAPQRLLVDEYTQSSSGSYVLSKAATELATYLQRRAVSVALVPDVTAAAAGQLADVPNSVAAATKLRSMQSTNRVLMVAPTAFGFNDQAAQDNSFMHQAERPQEHSSLTSQVCGEFSELHRQLTEVAGVEVQLFQHHIRHGTPDAVFPNNWFSTHAAGEGAGGVGERTLVLYPMKCSNRAAERRPEIIQVLLQQYPRLVDMTAHESQSKSYFEGTGVLVLDRVNGVAYVALSERADRALAEEWVSGMGYKDLVTFHSSDQRGKSVYHTNVMMAIGTDVAVVCAESVADDKEKQNLLVSRLAAILASFF